MKIASGIIALILGLLTLLNVAGCSKAEKEYQNFLAYNNSSQGMAENFLRGWRGADQGDPLGPVFGVMDQDRTLAAGIKDARWSAWACLIGTALALFVFAVIPPKKPAASASQSIPTSTVQSAPAAEPSVEERLRTLLQLKASGLITPEEYDARVQQIVKLI